MAGPKVVDRSASRKAAANCRSKWRQLIQSAASREKSTIKLRTRRMSGRFARKTKHLLIDGRLLFSVLFRPSSVEAIREWRDVGSVRL